MVTLAALATGLDGVEVAETDGAVPAGGAAIGMVNVVVLGCVVLPPPTVSEKPRLRGALTTGATNVAVGLVGFVMVTTGSPGLTICAHRNGPFSGVLPAELRVTSVPAVIGVAELVKLATACDEAPGVLFGEQLAAGVASSGNGLSCPIVCVGCGMGVSARRAFS
jgi:hypothetical protein